MIHSHIRENFSLLNPLERSKFNIQMNEDRFYYPCTNVRLDLFVTELVHLYNTCVHLQMYRLQFVDSVSFI